jgi:hypothetical protein
LRSARNPVDPIKEEYRDAVGARVIDASLFGAWRAAPRY